MCSAFTVELVDERLRDEPAAIIVATQEQPGLGLVNVMPIKLRLQVLAACGRVGIEATEPQPVSSSHGDLQGLRFAILAGTAERLLETLARPVAGASSTLHILVLPPMSLTSSGAAELERFLLGLASSVLLSVGPLCLDVSRRVFTVSGEPVFLRRQLFRATELLMRRFP